MSGHESRTAADHREPASGTARAADALSEGIALLLVLMLAQRLIGFGRNLLVCRMLDPQSLGQWNLAHSFLLLAAPLIVLGIPGTFTRYVEHYRHRGRLGLFLRRSLVATLGLSSFSIALLALGCRWATRLAFGDQRATALYVGTLLALMLVLGFNYVNELLTALRQVRAVAWMQLVHSLLFALLAIFLLYATALEARALVAAYAVACLVSVSLGLRWLVPVWKNAARCEPAESGPMPFWSKLLPYAAWFWLTDLLANLFGTIDRYMILHAPQFDHENAIEMIGQYHSSQVLGILLMAVGGMLGNILLPYLSHAWEEGRQHDVVAQLNLSLKLISLALTLTAAAGLVAAPLIFQLLLDGKYAAGLQVLPLTMAYCIWFALIVVSANYLWCRERAWLVSAAMAVGLVANGLLNALWLPRWGLSGAVAATAVAHLLTLVIMAAVSYGCGMRFGAGTVMLLVAPALLCFGPAVAASGLLIVAVAGLDRNWWFTAQERVKLDQLGRSYWEKLRKGSAVG